MKQPLYDEYNETMWRPTDDTVYNEVNEDHLAPNFTLPEEIEYEEKQKIMEEKYRQYIREKKADDEKDPWVYSKEPVFDDNDI
jgi:hypothetical protein